MKKLGNIIKGLRKEAELTPSQLAEKSGLSLAYIVKLEDGQYENLSLKTMKSLSEGLGLSLSNFLQAIGYMEEYKNHSGMELVFNALRSNEFTKSQAEKVIDYARFIKTDKKL